MDDFHARALKNLRERHESKRQVFRYTVPVDDRPHVIYLTNEPLHIANGGTLDEVEFWAEHDTGALEYPAAFQVVGTGHPLPNGARYVGTAPRTREGLVWHLYRLDTTAIVLETSGEPAKETAT